MTSPSTGTHGAAMIKLEENPLKCLEINGLLTVKLNDCHLGDNKRLAFVVERLKPRRCF
jgi:hypothetical protein